VAGLNVMMDQPVLQKQDTSDELSKYELLKTDYIRGVTSTRCPSLKTTFDTDLRALT
jgi:hypothetical protein